MENYKIADRNLIYLKAYKRFPERAYFKSGTTNIYREIKDIPLNKFLAVNSVDTFFSGAWDGFVVTYCSNKENPIENYEVSKIEIYIRNNYMVGDLSYTMDEEYEFKKFGNFIYNHNVSFIEDSNIINEIIACAQRSNNNSEIAAKELNTEKGIFTLRIHFKEYENLVWDAEISEYQGKYFLMLLSSEHEEPAHYYADATACYVGPNFDALMESLLNSEIY